MTQTQAPNPMEALVKGLEVALGIIFPETGKLDEKQASTAITDVKRT